MEFITKYSESVRIGTKETISGPSMTEPDNAMSIPEIIARFTRGQGLAVQARPWEAGSASEDGQPVEDADLEEFLNGPKHVVPAAPAAEPAPADLVVPPAPPAPAAHAVPTKQVIPGGPGMDAQVVDAPAQ